MDYGNFLREQRLKSGKTQQELAEAAGVTKRSIAYWESGKRKMSLENACKLFEALGITVTIGNSV